MPVRCPHDARTVRAPCGHRAGTVWALCTALDTRIFVTRRALALAFQTACRASLFSSTAFFDVASICGDQVFATPMHASDKIAADYEVHNPAPVIDP